MSKGKNIILILAVMLVGSCGAPTPTVVETVTTITPLPIPSATPSPFPTETITTIPHTPTPTLTLTPPIPLEPEQARATIQALLREPIDCAAPCFFGITPGQTTLGEAWNIFTLLGIQHERSVYRHPDYKGMRLTTARYDFLRMGFTLIARDDIVMYLQVWITPEEQKAGIPREWLTYSPETLISRYGSPSRVSLSVDRGPNLFITMTMFFDERDLIVGYLGDHVTPYKAGPLEICPLTAQFDGVWLGMGKDPTNAPEPILPLERATGMTMEEFSQLMTGNHETACFIIKNEEFIR
jgi:hypothetical protein